MTRNLSYTNEDLRDAIAASTSWRGTLRVLGLAGTSAGSMRSVRLQAERAGIDFGHFKGQRRWTEEHLRAAIVKSKTWSDVVDALALEGAASVAMIKGHAVRLGLDTSHLAVQRMLGIDAGPQPSMSRLDRAGSLLAAAWLTLCGHDVSWPLEPSRYDLLVATEFGIRRVQVKTTKVQVGDTWKVDLSAGRGGRKTYDPDEIDHFFIIDGSLTCYLIPVAAVGGLHSIHLRPYARYRLGQMALSHVR